MVFYIFFPNSSLWIFNKFSAESLHFRNSEKTRKSATVFSKEREEKQEDRCDFRERVIRSSRRVDAIDHRVLTSTIFRRCRTAEKDLQELLHTEGAWFHPVEMKSAISATTGAANFSNTKDAGSKLRFGTVRAVKMWNSRSMLRAEPRETCTGCHIIAAVTIILPRLSRSQAKVVNAILLKWFDFDA